MSYVTKTLLDGESITYKAQLHWWIFVYPALLLVLSIILMFGNFHNTLEIAGGVLCILGIWSITTRFIHRITSDFVVTNKRVVLKTGLIRRNVSDLQLNKTEGILFEESVLGRIMGYGTIIVTTGGITNTYPYVSSPLLFKRAINSEIDNMNARTGRNEINPKNEN